MFSILQLKQALVVNSEPNQAYKMEENSQQLKTFLKTYLMSGLIQEH